MGCVSFDSFSKFEKCVKKCVKNNSNKDKCKDKCINEMTWIYDLGTGFYKGKYSFYYYKNRIKINADGSCEEKKRKFSNYHP